MPLAALTGVCVSSPVGVLFVLGGPTSLWVLGAVGREGRRDTSLLLRSGHEALRPT